MAATKKVAAPTATSTLKPSEQHDNPCNPDLSSKRAERIAKRRADMPKVYRASYDRAVSGKSLRAAINSFCLECVQWQKAEVRLCTSLACPLYAVRPYQGSSKLPPEGSDCAVESPNGGGAGVWSKSRVIVLDQQLVKSEAWLRLSGTAKAVFLIFRCKCQFEKIKTKPGKKKLTIVNNGKIVFTYKEAQERYGISAASFRTGIDQLTEQGFIDVTATGAGYRKMTTLYAISDRWRQYGTDEFKTVKRPRSRSNPGFKKGNRLWQRRQR